MSCFFEFCQLFLFMSVYFQLSSRLSLILLFSSYFYFLPYFSQNSFAAMRIFLFFPAFAFPLFSPVFFRAERVFPAPCSSVYKNKAPLGPFCLTAPRAAAFSDAFTPRIFAAAPAAPLLRYRNTFRAADRSPPACRSAPSASAARSCATFPCSWAIRISRSASAAPFPTPPASRPARHSSVPP